MQLIFHYYILLTAVIMLYMSIWFGVAVILKRNDVADIAWGLGFLLVGLITYLNNDIEFGRSLLVTTLVAIWALRLTTHIFIMNKDKEEDSRYREWRESWGKWFYIKSYTTIFLFQGFLLLLISAPVIISNIHFGGELNLLDVLGLLIWCVGFFFESVGDWQFSQFTKNPENKGKVMNSGLWQYTRHPNYFGEATQWWGLWVIALSVPYGWISVIGPLTITFLILKVSGIPILEEKLKENPNYQEYQKQVSKFFPLPPKK